MNISIIGAGHGGLALSGYFALTGHQVTLYAHTDHPGAINEVRLHGGISIKGQGFGKIQTITSQINIAIIDAAIIFLALPVIAHAPIFNSMLPYLRDGQIIVNLSGHFSGIFQNEILNHRNIYIADTTSFPYACRISKSCEVEIISTKQNIGIASTSKYKTAYIISCLKDIFPTKLVAKKSLIEIGFYDPSGISHVPNTIFNAGRIGNNEEFYFYKDGITIETAILLDKMDKERIEIGALLGIDLIPYYAVMNEYYALNHTSIYDFFKNSPIHNAKYFCPTTLNSRYLTEDVPYSLVPWYSAGISLGYTAHATKNIIEISSIIHQTDYLKTGRLLSLNYLEDYHLCG
jgi:opine dehydrogenase